jgi:glyoxylase-like metal-dependent hydrolase (beta-lactamase superfamily II)
MTRMRVLRPADNVFAFYDGRVEGYRNAPERNWVDEGALALGIASYAIVSAAHALVYDTHVSVEHAGLVRDALEAEGVTSFTVVLSHCHLDHVAGTAAFRDCEVIGCERTAEQLTEKKAAIEQGTLAGPPAINPLILPTQVFAERMSLTIGDTEVELLHTDIHSDDATVAWLPDQRLLLCGDTLEDTVTYVSDPGKLETHLANLDDLRALNPSRILPNHGDPDVIAAGGYPAEFIDATQHYLAALLRAGTDAALRELPLRELIAESLSTGSLHYFAPYEEVHQANVKNALDVLT